MPSLLAWILSKRMMHFVHCQFLASGFVEYAVNSFNRSSSVAFVASIASSIGSFALFIIVTNITPAPAMKLLRVSSC